MRSAIIALALIAQSSTGAAGSKLIAPVMIDFPHGSASATPTVRQQIDEAMRMVGPYRTDTSAYLCAVEKRGSTDMPALKARRIGTVRNVLRKRGIARVHHDAARCAEMPQEERSGVLIFWRPQWR